VELEEDELEKELLEEELELEEELLEEDDEEELLIDKSEVSFMLSMTILAVSPFCMS
jgi:hypothetical protein